MRQLDPNDVIAEVNEIDSRVLQLAIERVARRNLEEENEELRRQIGEATPDTEE
jgi:hypothetical protein